MRISLTRSTCLAMLVLSTSLISATGCKSYGWGGWSKMSWSKPWGGSGENLAASKPSTTPPTPSSSASPSGTSVASSSNPAASTWNTAGAGATTTASTPAYPATGQAYSYPTQTAAGYQANGTAGTVAPTAGYQTGPYSMASGQTAAAPATSAPAGGVPAGGVPAGTTWNTNTAAAAPPASYGQAQGQAGYGYSAPSYAAPAPNAQTYQTADQRSAVGYQAPASTYGQPNTSYQAPAAGYTNGYSPAPSSPATYGPPANNGGSPYSNQGAANSAGSYQPVADYQQQSQPAASYSGTPVADPTTIAPSQPSYSVPAYSPPSYATGAAAAPGRPVLPAALTSDAAGYRPGSTGRSEVQNAQYDSPAASSGYGAVPAYNSGNAPVYGNTYQR